MPKMNVKKGDTVEVISGKDKGKQGLVLRAYPEEGKVLVEGVAIVKKATRPNQMNQQGGIVDKPAKIDVSNVMLVMHAEPAPLSAGPVVCIPEAQDYKQLAENRCMRA